MQTSVTANAQIENENKMRLGFANDEINDYSSPFMFMDSNLLTSTIPQLCTVENYICWFGLH